MILKIRFFLDLQTCFCTNFMEIDAAPKRIKLQRSAWWQIEAFFVAYQFQDSLDLGSLWRGLGGLLSISKPVRMTDGMESAWDWHKLTEDCIDGSSWNWCTGIEEKGDLLSVCACSLLLQCSFLSLGVICYLSVSYVFSFSHMRLYHICPVGFT